MTDYTSLSDDALYKLIRRRAGDKPTDQQSHDTQIAELHALAAEVRGRVEKRNAQTPSQ
jgi:hypothetical protein